MRYIVDGPSNDPYWRRHFIDDIETVVDDVPVVNDRVPIRTLNELRPTPIANPDGRMPIRDIVANVLSCNSIDVAGLAQQWTPQEFEDDPFVKALLGTYRKGGNIRFDKIRSVIRDSEGVPFFADVGSCDFLPGASDDQREEVDAAFLDACTSEGFINVRTPDGNPAYVKPALNDKKLFKTLSYQASRKGLRTRANWDPVSINHALKTALYRDLPEAPSEAFGDLERLFIKLRQNTRFEKSAGWSAHVKSGPKRAWYEVDEDWAETLTIAVLRLLKIATLGHRVVGIMSPAECIAHGIKDPETCFGKNELVTWKKDSLDLLRTIWPNSVIDNLVLSIMHVSMNKAQIVAYQEGNCESLFCGVGHHDAGLEHLTQVFDKITADKSFNGTGRIRSIDNSFYDLSITRDAQMAACGARIDCTKPIDPANCLSPDDLRIGLSEDTFNPAQLEAAGVSHTFCTLMHCVDLLQGIHVIAVGTSLLMCCKAGITGSGVVDTTSTNSLIQTLAHRLCGVVFGASGGDDNLSQEYLDFLDWLYTQIGFVIKPESENTTGPDGPIIFNSIEFQRDDARVWSFRFLNVDKLLIGLRHFIVDQSSCEDETNVQRLESYRFVLRNNVGDWDALVRAFARVGITIPDVQLRRHAEHISPVIDSLFEEDEERVIVAAPEAVPSASDRFVAELAAKQAESDKDRATIADLQAKFDALARSIAQPKVPVKAPPPASPVKAAPPVPKAPPTQAARKLVATTVPKAPPIGLSAEASFGPRQHPFTKPITIQNELALAAMLTPHPLFTLPEGENDDQECGFAADGAVGSANVAKRVVSVDKKAKNAAKRARKAAKGSLNPSSEDPEPAVGGGAVNAASVSPDTGN